MINPLNVAFSLLENVKKVHNIHSQASEEELRLARKLSEFLLRCGDEDKHLNIEDGVETLHYDYVHTLGELTDDDVTNLNKLLFCDDYDSENEDDSCQDSQKSSQQSNYSTETPSPKKPRVFVDIEYKCKVVDYWEGKKQKDPNKTTYRSFDVVQKRYSKLKCKSQLERWKKHVLDFGSRNDKLRSINEKVLDKFVIAKDKALIIHDIDIMRWALQINKEVKLDKFRASKTWLYNFKRHNAIVSRKVTKFITQTDIKNEKIIKEKAADFVTETKEAIKEYGATNFVNTDQTGFAREIHSGRTLDVKWKKHILALAQSKNAMTHSYTVMPAITMAGKLLPKQLVVIQEPLGHFPPTITVRQRPNIVALASKSGKMSKNHMIDFYKEVLLPNIGPRTLLALDGWTGFNDPAMLEASLNDSEQKEVDTRRIPAGTTGEIQPLDVMYNRQLKGLVRPVNDFVLLDDVEYDLKNRDNIIKLQSVCHNQLSSPRYEEMIKYAFYKSGYTDERPEDFVVPAKFCYSKDAEQCSKCENFQFLKCSWCKQLFCFEHFLVMEPPHYCSEYIP